MIVIVGNGNMAFSIANGLKDVHKLVVVGRSMAKLDEFEANLGVSIQKELIDGFDVSDKSVILCVKPANIAEVSTKLNGRSRVLYSVLAGVSIERLKQNFKSESVVRAMPNLAASVHRSMTTLCGDEEYKDEAKALFGSIGETLWLNTQNELDIATALAGSGPAFLALVAEALSDGAVREGLTRRDALALTRGLFSGFAPLLEEIKPSDLKDSVMSPAGTTAAGYATLEQAGVRSAFMEAISKAYKRAKEL